MKVGYTTGPVGERLMAHRGVIMRGLLLDAAVIFRDDGSGSVEFVVDAPQFLLRLRYSKMLLGIYSSAVHHDQDSISKQTALLEEIGLLEATQLIFSCRDQPVWESVTKLELKWDAPPTACVYVTSQWNDPLEGHIGHRGWTVIRLISGERGSKCLGAAVPTFEKLEEVPAILANLNKRALGTKLVVVGHCMKWSRELDFLKRGAFPLVPNEYGLSFIHVQLDHSLEQQIAAVDMLLHKATDETFSFPSGEYGFPASIQFSKNIRKLQRHLHDTPRICVVDPFDRILPLLDRGATQAILRSVKLPGQQQIIRPPRCVEVKTFDEPWLSQELEAAKIVLPAIVKSQVAFGMPEAHTMAVVFRKEGFNGLMVPLPASIQEYVDHGAFQYKMYVLGNKLMYSRRRSTPNAAALADANHHAASILFDSLKSLPTVKDSGTHEEQIIYPDGRHEDLNLDAVQAFANCLRSKLGLTILGFDLVVEAETNDYVIVDVNYLPSFKDVPDAEALPAFWNALLTSYREWPSCPIA